MHTHIFLCITVRNRLCLSVTHTKSAQQQVIYTTQSHLGRLQTSPVVLLSRLCLKARMPQIDAQIQVKHANHCINAASESSAKAAPDSRHRLRKWKDSRLVLADGWLFLFIYFFLLLVLFWLMVLTLDNLDWKYSWHINWSSSQHVNLH